MPPDLNAPWGKRDLMAFPEPPVPVSVGQLQYVGVNKYIWKD